MQNLPVNGRNFIDFALLTPGVTKDVRTGDISFAGQRGTLNSLVVDGADNNNTFFGQALGRTGSGRAPYQFSQDAVREFQVNSNSYSAEYGRAGGAVINVVTKSGTNDLHGSGFWFVRDKSDERQQRHQRAARAAEVAVSLRSVRRHGRRPDPQGQVISSSSTTTGSATRPRTRSSSTCPPARPPIPRRRRPSRGCGRWPTSWEQKFDQDVFLIKTRLAAHVGAPADAALQPSELQGRRTSSRAAPRTRSSTPARRTSSRGRSTSRWRRSSGPRSSTRRASRWREDREPGEANSANPEALINQGTTRVLTIGRNFFSPRETTIERWQVADTLTWIARRAQAEGRIRLPVRRHPQLLPRQLLGLLHVQHAWRRSKAAARPARASATSRRSGATARPARRRGPTFRSIRSSRRTSGGCGPTSPSTPVCATTSRSSRSRRCATRTRSSPPPASTRAC